MGFPGTRARATIGRMIDIKTINQVIDLLKDFGVIHIDLFASLFDRKHGLGLDASALGFDDGLYGFFREIADVVTLFENGEIKLRNEESLVKDAYISHAVCLNRKEPLGIILDRINRRKERNLFDTNETILWSEKYKYLLEIELTEITIDKSPFEVNFQCDRISNVKVMEIHRVLVKHTNGIKLSELRNLINLNLRLFNSPSFDTVTVVYPELFYRVEPEQEGDEPIIFDGKTRTIDDLSGKSVSNRPLNPVELCKKFVLSGLYQKTLILIRKAGAEGLKIAVWRSTIEKNQGIFKAISIEEKRLLEREPLDTMLALASQEFVLITSHPLCKNDLRVNFPRANNILFWFDSLKRQRRQANGSIESTVSSSSSSSS